MGRTYIDNNKTGFWFRRVSSDTLQKLLDVHACIRMFQNVLVTSSRRFQNKPEKLPEYSRKFQKTTKAFICMHNIAD